MMMKKLFCMLIGFNLVLPAWAQGTFEPWITDIKTGTGHVTYTFNMLVPLDNDTLHFKVRKDYICSQKMQAALWGEATYLLTGKTVDYTSLMDKKILRKYVPVTQDDYDQIIKYLVPYCH